MLVVSVLHFVVELPWCDSLKDKRRVVRSLKDQITHKFHLSVAEIDYQDVWGAASLGCAIVSNSKDHGERVLRRVLNYIEIRRGDRVRDMEVFSEHYG